MAGETTDAVSVAVAQRHLLEAIASYGGCDDDVARGWAQHALGAEFLAVARLAAERGDSDQANVLAAVSTLINSVGHEQLERKVAG